MNRSSQIYHGLRGSTQAGQMGLPDSSHFLRCGFRSRRFTFMKRYPLFTVLWLFSFVGQLGAAVLYDQTALLNTINSARGANWSSQGDLPRQGSGLSPTAGQFQSAVIWGAVSVPTTTTTPNSGESLEANSDILELPRIKANGVSAWVLQAQSGAGYISRTIAFYFGSVISPPNTDANGAPLVGVTASEYWAPEPFTSNNHEGAGYYSAPYTHLVSV